MSVVARDEAEATMRHAASLRVRVLAICLTAILSIGLLEISLLAVGPFKRAGKTPDYVLWESDAAIGFVPARHLDVLFYTNEWINRVRTDFRGFRVAGAGQESGVVDQNTILFLGDSQTMGIPVAATETFVARLGMMLARRGSPFRTVNAGCNGFDTAQEYLFFRKLFDAGARPGIVVLYATNNDLFEDVPGLPYGRYRIDDRGLLWPESPDPAKVTLLRDAKTVAPRRPAWWLEHSALARNAWYTYRILRRDNDAAGWLRILYLRDDADALAGERWRAVAAAIRSLNQLVESYGGRLLVAVNPDPVEWSDAYFDRLRIGAPSTSGHLDRMKLQHGYRRVATAAGAAFVDMLDGFPAISVRDFRFALDPHANASGHRVIAEQLARGLERAGVFSSPATSKGKTTQEPAT